MSRNVKITVELPPEEAAALKRLCDKITHADALAYLYPHVRADIRNDQAYDVIHATARVCEALCDAGVSDWPWVETRQIKH